MTFHQLSFCQTPINSRATLLVHEHVKSGNMFVTLVSLVKRDILKRLN